MKWKKYSLLTPYRQVPTFAYEKRLSRIETLRLAITYISFMDELLAAPAQASGPCRRGQGQAMAPRGPPPHLATRGEDLLHPHVNPFGSLQGGSAMCQQDLIK